MTNNNVTETLVSPSSPVDAAPATIEHNLSGPSSGKLEKPVAETPLEPESAIAKEPEDPKFASRFAALSRKEKELIHRERAFKENQAKLQAYEKAVATAKVNPLEYLQAAGLTLEQALQQIINQDGDQPVTEAHRIQQIEKKISDYEKEQAEAHRRMVENRKTAELNSIKSNINDFIQANSEQFELIKEYNAIEDVWGVIERTYIESKGQVHLTMEQASQAVEDHLYKEAEQEQMRIARIKKLQKNQQPSSAGESIQVSKEEKVRIPSPTLTNQSATVSTEPRTFKSREESLADAAKLLKWK